MNTKDLLLKQIEAAVNTKPLPIGRYEIVERKKVRGGCIPSAQEVESVVEYLVSVGRDAESDIGP